MLYPRVMDPGAIDSPLCDGCELARPRTWLLCDQSGSASVEYVVVTMVGLMIAAALGGLGLAMVDAFGASLTILYSEYP